MMDVTELQERYRMLHPDTAEQDLSFVRAPLTNGEWVELHHAE